MRSCGRAVVRPRCTHAEEAPPPPCCQRASVVTAACLDAGGRWTPRAAAVTSTATSARPKALGPLPAPTFASRPRPSLLLPRCGHFCACRAASPRLRPHPPRALSLRVTARAGGADAAGATRSRDRGGLALPPAAGTARRSARSTAPSRSPPGRNRQGVQGGSLEPPGPLVRTSIPFIQRSLSAVPTRLNPLAEGTRFSQVVPFLSDCGPTVRRPRSKPNRTSRELSADG